ncbi:MAG: hypothetical protein WC526_00720 [Patescibacteria group bacterium]
MARNPRPARRVLVACYRFRTLAVVELTEGERPFVLKHCIRGLRRNLARAVAFVLRDANTSRPRLIVADNALLADELRKTICAVPIQTITIATAKEVLLPAEHRPNHHDLYHHLLRQHPHLRRYVTVIPSTGHIAESERWRTVVLLAVALGLAAQQQARGGNHRRPTGRPVA